MAAGADEEGEEEITHDIVALCWTRVNQRERLEKSDNNHANIAPYFTPKCGLSGFFFLDSVRIPVLKECKG